jgi:hypothetical protein
LQTEILSSLPANAREQFLANLDLVADACRVAAKQAGKEKPTKKL